MLALREKQKNKNKNKKTNKNQKLNCVKYCVMAARQ